MPNPPPDLDQYYPGGTAQQALDWNAEQHQAIASGDQPTGPILNWGVVTTNMNGVTVTFDYPYLEAPPSVTLGDTSTTHSRITAITLTDFSVTGQGDVNWQAMGR
jgi:hypothetical protein